MEKEKRRGWEQRLRLHREAIVCRYQRTREPFISIRRVTDTESELELLMQFFVCRNPFWARQPAHTDIAVKKN